MLTKYQLVPHLLDIAQRGISTEEPRLTALQAQHHLGMSATKFHYYRVEHLIPRSLGRQHAAFPLSFVQGLELFRRNLPLTKDLLWLFLIRYAYEKASTDADRTKVLSIRRRLVARRFLLPARPAAQGLGITQDALRGWLKRGSIPAIRLGTCWYFSAELIAAQARVSGMLTAEQAADRLDMPVQQLQLLAREGKIPYEQDLDGHRRYDEACIQELGERRSKKHNLTTRELACLLGVSLSAIWQWHQWGLIKGTLVSRFHLTFEAEEAARVKQALETYVTTPEYKWLEEILRHSPALAKAGYLTGRQAAVRLGLSRTSSALAIWRNEGLVPTFTPQLLVDIAKPPQLYLKTYIDRFSKFSGGRASRKSAQKYRDLCAERGVLVGI